MAPRPPRKQLTCLRTTRRAIAAISTHSAPDTRIRGLRAPKPAVDPWKPHGTILEEERAGGGQIECSLTVFLTGAECPFTCSFCDLWRWTTDGPTPSGALTAQLAAALEDTRPPFPDRLKLYNASNFFDRRAVPIEDLPRIAELAQPFAAVTVESHANTIGAMTLEFGELVPGRLEVAVGLETIHPVALEHLNKRLDLARFDAAAGFLAEHGMDLRAFVLLGAPYVPPEESIEWTVRTVDYAVARGAQRVAIIPVRGGNGELERLRALGHFTPATLHELETALEYRLTIPAAVTADVWDVQRLPACDTCRSERVERIKRMNLTGRVEPAVSCPACA
jgi:archaeosine synthase beta-subunit